MRTVLCTLVAPSVLLVTSVGVFHNVLLVVSTNMPTLCRWRVYRLALQRRWPERLAAPPPIPQRPVVMKTPRPCSQPRRNKNAPDAQLPRPPGPSRINRTKHPPSGLASDTWMSQFFTVLRWLCCGVTWQALRRSWALAMRLTATAYVRSFLA